MSQYEDLGFPPVVVHPLKVRQPHMSIPVGLTPITIELPKEECLSVILQSSGSGSIRITFDGSNPSSTSGFILTSSMQPTLFNLCGKTVILKVVGSRANGCSLECQIGD